MEFALYVSPVEGRTVRRFGAPPGTYIGAKRVGKQIEWNEERIVPIPDNEYRRFRAEYHGAIADGALKLRTADEYKAQQDARKAKRTVDAPDAGDAPVAYDAAPPVQATGIRAIAETAPIVSPTAQTERPKALLLNQTGGR